MGRKQGSCRRENLPFPKKWQANSEEQKTRCFPVGKRRTRPKCNRQSSSRTFILSPRKNAVLTAGLLTSTLEIEISTSASCLLAEGLSPAMAGFRPGSIRCFGIGLVRTAPVEWFSRSLASGPIKTTSPDYCTSDGFYEVFSPRKTPRGSVLSYTKKGEIAMLLRKYSYITYR